MRRAVRVLGISGVICLSACNNSTNGGSRAGAAPSASAVPPAKAALHGTYRWEAIIGYNDQAIAKIGGKRLSVLESMRNTADNLTMVAARTTWTFGDTSATVRFKAVYRLKGDGSYTWAHCAASGGVAWKVDTLVVPTEIATHGESGSYGKTTHSSGGCSARDGPCTATDASYAKGVRLALAVWAASIVLATVGWLALGVEAAAAAVVAAFLATMALGPTELRRRR